MGCQIERGVWLTDTICCVEDDILTIGKERRNINDFSTKVDAFYAMLKWKYLEPAKFLLDNNKSDYAAMTLLLPLIELIGTLERGEVGEGHSNEDFGNALRILGLQVHNRRNFYHTVRCGILHTAMSKNGNLLGNEYLEPVAVESGRYVINVILVLNMLTLYFENFMRTIQADANGKQARKFERVFRQLILSQN